MRGFDIRLAAAVLALSWWLRRRAPAGAEDCQTALRQHVRPDPEGDLREPRLHQRRPATTPAASGGLDLRADVAYDSLVDQPSETVAGLVPRRSPGSTTAACSSSTSPPATLPDQFTAPLRADAARRPAGALRQRAGGAALWIENGAPRTGTVAGTGELLNACLPPPEPIEIEPLPPPAAGRGRADPHAALDRRQAQRARGLLRQLLRRHRSGAGGVPRPERHRSASSATEIRQDPLSHHLIVNLYTGKTPITDPVWGGFNCRGGDKDGQTCDPIDARRVRRRQRLRQRAGDQHRLLRRRQPAGRCLRRHRRVRLHRHAEGGGHDQLAPGVYNELPLKGMIIWNSHAFNLTDEDGKLEAWLNFYFAAPDEQQYPLQGIFDAIRRSFKMNVPAFQAEEVCNIHALPPQRPTVRAQLAHAPARQALAHLRRRVDLHGRPQRRRACSPLGPGSGLPDHRPVRRRAVRIAPAAQDRRLQRRPDGDHRRADAGRQHRARAGRRWRSAHAST